MRGTIEGIRTLLFMNRQAVKQNVRLIADWWAVVLGMLIEQSITLAFLGIIFFRINAVKEWTIHEMIFLLGLFILSRPLYRIFFQGAADISLMVLDGTLDQYLIRPCNPLMLILTSRSNPVAYGEIVFGLVLIAVSGSNLSVDWNAPRLLFMFAAVLAGNLVYLGTHLLKGFVCVIAIRIDAVNALLQQFQQYSKYPISLYHPYIKLLLVSLLPYGLASSVPAAVILGRDSMPWYAWLAPACCVLYAGIAAVVFLWGLRFYRSTGS